MSLAMNEFIVSTLTLKTIFFFIKKCFAGLKKKKIIIDSTEKEKEIKEIFFRFPTHE